MSRKLQELGVQYGDGLKQAAIAAAVEELKSSSLLSEMLGQKHEWNKWAQEIPYIRWPWGWAIKAVPPQGGAIIRYNIKTLDCNFVSVYLDCYDNLGSISYSDGPKPYWEVYPHYGDVARCPMDDVDKLIELIGECR